MRKRWGKKGVTIKKRSKGAREDKRGNGGGGTDSCGNVAGNAGRQTRSIVSKG